MAAKLSWPQRNMLKRAAANTDGSGTVRLGPGESRTAKSLKALGLGAYLPTGVGHQGNPARFVIGTEGQKALDPEADTEAVRADELREGDVVVTYLAIAEEQRRRTITRLGVDGHWIHIGMGEGSPLSFQRHEKVRRMVKT